MGLVAAVRDMRTIRQLLTRAEAEARSDGQETPGPEHLLLPLRRWRGRNLSAGQTMR